MAEDPPQDQPDPDGAIAEAEEPNDAREAAVEFELPELDGAPISLQGCLTPADKDGDDQPDTDVDRFAFTTSGPAMVELTLAMDGAAAPGPNAAGFVVDSDHETLAADKWQRAAAGVATAGGRPIFVPAAARYVVTVTDANSVLGNTPAAGPEACYRLRVAQVQVPPATALSDMRVATGELGAPTFISFTAPAQSMPQYAQLTAEADARASLVLLVNGDYAASATSTAEAPAAPTLPASGESAELLFVIEDVLPAPAAVPWQLEILDLGVINEPGDGAPVTYTQPEALVTFLAFSANAGDRFRYQFTPMAPAGAAFNVTVVDSTRTMFVGTICTGCTAAAEQDIAIAETGTHYVAVAAPMVPAGTEITVALTRTALPAPP
jgi:hypothetical protein